MTQKFNFKNVEKFTFYSCFLISLQIHNWDKCCHLVFGKAFVYKRQNTIVNAVFSAFDQRTLHNWEVLLYGWPPVLQVWIQLLPYILINNISSLLVKSSLFKLETSCECECSPTVSVL